MNTNYEELKERVKEIARENNRIKNGRGHVLGTVAEADLPTLEEVIYEDELEEDELDEYKVNSETYDITFIEFGILNKYFYSVYRKAIPPLSIDSYGSVDAIGQVTFGGPLDSTMGRWFSATLDGDDSKYLFQTVIFQDNSKEIVTRLNISVKSSTTLSKLEGAFEKIKILAFNNSEYVGKCIKIKLKENRFKGIEVINFDENPTELILTDTQTKYITHFISRVGRGGAARYLLNGQPGTGKTEAIRSIIKSLTPNVTFVIPDFTTCEDLTTILEGCTIFDKAVIIMDDVDLYLGSRDNGSYTKLLGEFLSFFDGVKKRKISLLSSTNDKGLVDKAAERPGRFNMTLDFTFLSKEQIEKVCNIHLPEKYRVKEVYDALNGTIDNKKAEITGAFIANLAENIREMSDDSVEWGLEDTISLIKESYRGFYMSQVKTKEALGFKIN